MEQKDLKQLINHIVQSEDKNALIFTYDITNYNSFHHYLKEALKTFILEKEELSDSQRMKRNIPFMILGLKKDQIEKIKVDNDDVLNLIRVIKDYVSCELLQVSNAESEDVLASMKCLFELANEVFFQQNRPKKGLSSYSRMIEK